MYNPGFLIYHRSSIIPSDIEKITFLKAMQKLENEGKYQKSEEYSDLFHISFD